MGDGEATQTVLGYYAAFLRDCLPPRHEVLVATSIRNTTIP